jgi:predicted nucleic acid-binding protein
MLYADTSFLTAIYLPEPESRRILKWMQTHDQGLPFTPLHRHELRTGMRQRVLHGSITLDELKDAFRAVESDLEDGILNHTPIPWTESFREAERIGEDHGTIRPIRSLDLLHVGIAHALQRAQFLTFDKRQKEVAKLAGLNVSF